jgi:uncharacterized protein (DUF885 family)
MADSRRKECQLVEAGDVRVAALAEEYFEGWLRDHPFDATVYGVPGFGAAVPDPSREADRARHEELGRLLGRLVEIDPETLGEADRITVSTLNRRLADDRAELTGALSEVGVSASVSGLLSGTLVGVGSAALSDASRAEDYLARLAELGGYFDGWTQRYRQAAADGRYPTLLGVRQAVRQLDDLLARDIAGDPFARPALPSDVDEARWRGRAESLIRGVIRPSLARMRMALADEIGPRGRDEERVGIRHVPDGEHGYLAAVGAHTTTTMTPEEIHQLGMDIIAGLRVEFAELGDKVLGTSDVDKVVARLRGDRGLRFTGGEQIVRIVTGALNRATEVLPDCLRADDVARVGPCEVHVMSELEAEGGVLGYYLPPASDGSRAGRHAVNTLRPATRLRFEYEVLAFHESVPGHHVQIALGQAQQNLPRFRRFGQFTAHVEGWALYAERLAGELGLYTSNEMRLGVVSFDAWRAARLVVDTGMHHYGWSRTRAIEFMLANTALSEANIEREVDRYIAWPGQALAYMIGRRRIETLRSDARRVLGGGFDIGEFHHRILSSGAVPLDTLTEIVERWLDIGSNPTGTAS